jgi:hypothetical protein
MPLMAFMSKDDVIIVLWASPVKKAVVLRSIAMGEGNWELTWAMHIGQHCTFCFCFVEKSVKSYSVQCLCHPCPRTTTLLLSIKSQKDLTEHQKLLSLAFNVTVEGVLAGRGGLHPSRFASGTAVRTRLLLAPMEVLKGVWSWLQHPMQINLQI